MEEEDLIKFERVFFKRFDLEKLKVIVKNELIEYIKDKEVIKEFEDCLPVNVNFSDLDMEYERILIHLSGKTYKKPFYRVRFTLSFENKKIFWYDLQFDFENQIEDDFFDSYY